MMREQVDWQLAGAHAVLIRILADLARAEEEA